jgi:hypothetical protein
MISQNLKALAVRRLVKIILKRLKHKFESKFSGYSYWKTGCATLQKNPNGVHGIKFFFGRGGGVYREGRAATFMSELILTYERVTLLKGPIS